MSSPPLAECALLAREHGESLRGTAPQTTGWLCIERPGAWGRDAVRDSGLPPAARSNLQAGMDELPVRVQLLRRPGGAERERPHRVFLVHAGPRHQWIERLEIQDDAWLGGLDMEVLTSPTPPGLGEAHPEPLLLACTHAKRDACCARWGLPVATALASAHGDLVWETTHVGGHRFAGNLVLLPAGLVHGYLQPEDALRVATRYRDGLIDLATLRGRAGLPRPAQAAEWYVRDVAAIRGVDDIRIGPGEDLGDGATRFRVDAAGTPFTVTVREEATGQPRLTGCDKLEPADPGQFVLVEATPVR